MTKLKQVLVMLISFLTMISIGYAEEVPLTKKENFQEITPGSSTYNRSDKSFSILFQPIGFGPTNGVTQGAQVAFFLEPNSQIVLDYTTMNDYSTSSVFSDHEVDQETGISLGLHWKVFVANTFYLKTGLIHRTYNYKYREGCSTFLINNCTDNSYLDTQEEIDLSGTSESASFAIGNQWQFDSFTLGCDWFGMVFPLSHKINSYDFRNSKGGTDPARSKIQRNMIDSNIMVVRFYLGASF